MNILLLLFNRPDLARRVFVRIRDAKPRKLFVAADGPRPDRAGEDALCNETRRIIEDVDWPCEVKTLFRDRNLGCKEAISSAITWFFEHVEEGIILEDDCVPDPSFFPFCEELLARYRHDERIMAVSGDNHQNATFDPGTSYYYSIHPHCWGWATWRRAWAMYDGRMTRWPQLRDKGWLEAWLHKDEIAGAPSHDPCRLEAWLGSDEIAGFWTDIFDAVHAGRINSWAYPWTFSCWTNGGLSVLPSNNLVTNIGFDARATHTTGAEVCIPTAPITFPLVHPPSILRNHAADIYTARHLFHIYGWGLAAVPQRLRWKWNRLRRRQEPGSKGRTKP